MTATARISEPVPEAEQVPRRPRVRAFVVALALGVVLLAAAAGVHVWATSAYTGSYSTSVPLEQRAAGAALAHRLEPWDERFATRATVMQEWLRGAQLLAQGRYLPAGRRRAGAARALREVAGTPDTEHQLAGARSARPRGTGRLAAAGIGRLA